MGHPPPCGSWGCQCRWGQRRPELTAETLSSPAVPSICRQDRWGSPRGNARAQPVIHLRRAWGGQTCSSLFRGRTRHKTPAQADSSQTLPSASPVNSPQQGSTQEEIHWQFKFNCLQLGTQYLTSTSKPAPHRPQFRQIHGPVFQAKPCRHPWLFSHPPPIWQQISLQNSTALLPSSSSAVRPTLTPHLDNSHSFHRKLLPATPLVL